MKKTFAAIAATAALVLGATACSTIDEGGSGDSTAPADGDYSVGMTFSDLSNPVWAELVQEAQTYGEDQGMAVNYVDATGDSAKQVTQIENFIQQDVDAIIITAVDAQALVDVTQRAQDAGIKVVGYTQVLDNYDAQYLVDAYATGYANGEAAAEWINANYGDEDVVEWALMDLPTFPEIIDRANGIKEAVEELAPNAELVATNSALTAEEGVTNAENFLQANPDLKMIATIGGGGAQGANEGAKAHVSDFDAFGVFGIDATDVEVQAIINGDPQKSTISLGGGKAHGRTLIDITASLLSGEDVEKDQYMPVEVINSDNAQAYYDEMFG